MRVRPPRSGSHQEHFIRVTDLDRLVQAIKSAAVDGEQEGDWQTARAICIQYGVVDVPGQAQVSRLLRACHEDGTLRTEERYRRSRKRTHYDVNQLDHLLAGRSLVEVAREFALQPDGDEQSEPQIEPTAANDDPARSSSARKAPFIPSAFQDRILRLLSGKAMTADLLQSKLSTDRKTLYKRGINELMTHGLIANNRRVGGYYRPNSPPSKYAEFLGKNLNSETEEPTIETE